MTAAPLESRTAQIMGEDFIAARICLLLPELSGSAAPVVRTNLVRNIGTGRVTVEYRIGDHARVFAKLYSDDVGAQSYAVLKGLWDEGSASGEQYRIPEPLSYSPAEKLLIMRGVEGAELTSYIFANGSGLVESVGKAARWLARLHSSAIRVGGEGDFSAELLKLSNRMIKTVGEHPREWERLLELNRKLAELAKLLPQRRRLVQVHGRFRHDHVLVGSDGVSVIDWDRSCPWDPAIDLAEFLHLLRMAIFKNTGNPARVEPPTRAFLEEYLARLPDHAANLSFYWGFYILYSLSRNIKNKLDDDPESDAKIEFHLREFEDVVSGRFF